MNKKTVLITGGTRGIGAELIRLYRVQGYHVIATGSRRATVDRAKEKESGCEWHVCDLADRNSIVTFCESMGNRRLDVVIHNAGIQQLRNYFSPQDEQISAEQETMVNLTAPMLMTERLFQNVQQVEGTWVFVSSGLAIAPKQSSPVYCANKAGLRAFSKSLRAQAKFGGYKVAVCEAILPLVDTDMTRGRGKGKISANQAARGIQIGAEKRKAEIPIGATRVLMGLRRLFPNLAESIMLRA
ncbi:SDR family NAD(P)-dependent oxidoreductase [Thaumasiovibrio subtropicus]|uniref:SDR family NAD(P)-dependent oxidoreductase n=1 Tax=Thaumasiovibrio subtropicus TaxID=1891207 RepID=UPI000B34D3EA|nr:SDR family NAD(P)-dependent oxidoreductase [Thaumasiovibrio subtropicus]